MCIGRWLQAVDDRLKRTDSDRRGFEEDHFVRLTVPRQEKTLRKKRQRERERVDPLNDLTGGFAEMDRLAGTWLVASRWGGMYYLWPLRVNGETSCSPRPLGLQPQIIKHRGAQLVGPPGRLRALVLAVGCKVPLWASKLQFHMQ